MRWSYFKLAVLAYSLVASPTWAAEESPIEKLAVQAHVHRLIHAIEFGFGSLWMITACNSALGRVEAKNNEITEFRIDGITTPQAIAIGESAVWVSDRKRKAIFKIDPDTYAVVKVVQVPMLSPQGSIAVGEGAVWALTEGSVGDALTRVNAQNGVVEATIPLRSAISSIVVAYGSVWATGYAENELYRIDPRRNAISSVTKLHDTPRFLTAGEGAIWVLSQGDSSVQRIDTHNGELLATINTGLPPGAGDVTTGNGYVWVSTPGVPVIQIDPQTNTSIRRFVGGHGDGGTIRFGAGSLWIAGGRISRLQPPNFDQQYQSSSRHDFF
jgi:virginiamycin B lyase